MATATVSNITSMRDLIDEIDSFLVAEGFTQDSAPTGTTTGTAAWSIDTLFIQVEWSSENSFIIHQSTGYTGPISPGNHAGDSNFPSPVEFFGIDITNARLWGFSNDAALADGVRVANFTVEFNSDGRFAHFGWGVSPEKYNDWTGGAYKYGFQWSSGNPASEEPFNTGHRLLLDSVPAGVAPGSDLQTIRASGLPDQSASGDWLVFTSSDSSVTTTDANGNGVDKCYGFTRHGPWPAALLHIRGNPSNAWIPKIPIEIAYKSNAQDTRAYPLGRMRNIFVCNIGNFQPREIVNLGGQDYQVFPWAQKLTEPGAGIMASRNAGIMHLVDTA